MALTLPLAGCFLPNEIIPAAIPMPAAYRAGPRHADAALPSVVWWRGFGSKELTDLIEESLTSNFDVAAAVARIVQADANSRIAGAALLPIVDLNGSATRQRPSQSGGGGVVGANGVVAGGSGGSSERVAYSTSLSASYEIDFWGKNRAAMRAAEELAVASRFDREVVALTTVVSVANAYFLVLEAQRSPAHRARQPGRRHPRLQPDQAALRRRHRLRARHRAAGKPGQHPARLDPAAGADLAAEHGDARGADRPHAGSP